MHTNHDFFNSFYPLLVALNAAAAGQYRILISTIHEITRTPPNYHIERILISGQVRDVDNECIFEFSITECISPDEPKKFIYKTNDRTGYTEVKGYSYAYYIRKIFPLVESKLKSLTEYKEVSDICIDTI